MDEIINDVIIKPLKIISDERGSVMHMMKKDFDFYRGFGEVYFSTINPGFIKGWKKHLRMIQHYTVPVGNIKLVLYDGRNKSDTAGRVQEMRIGEENYCLVRIPAGVWYSFRAEGKKQAMVANCTDIPHDPSESISIDLDNEIIPYKWGL
jgi:dTDP-4-dehydrorhamnose 3,5-epimerase